jgi:hypothetical protein
VKICVNRWPNFFGAIISGALVVIFCLVLLARDPLVFWNDDYQISILPVLDDIARSWQEGHWPLLSPYSWVCGNLAGEFQYGTFSLFINAAIVTIWKIFAGFAHQAAALSIVHLVVLASGAFVLARSRGFASPLAIFVSLIAALNGWIVCWGAPDWLGALGAFAWMPWAWWGLERALNVGSVASRYSGPTSVRTPDGPVRWRAHTHRRDADATASRWRFLWPTPFVYLLATGGFPYTILMLGLLIGWLTIRSLVQTKSLFAVAPMLFGTALGFGLATPAIWALLVYVQGSAREAQPPLTHWQWIVPPTALPGFMLPCWTVKWANFSSRYLPHTATELACGLVVPAALVAGLLHQGRLLLRRFGWEFGLLLIALLISMFPTAGLFRWSFRWLPFVHLVLALCAAECLRALGENERTKSHRFGRVATPAVLALLFVGLIALASFLFHTKGQYAFPLTWILLGIAVAWVGLTVPAWMEGRAPESSIQTWMPAIITFASLLAIYLCIPPNCGVPRYNFTEQLKNPAPLDRDRLYLSVYPSAEVAYRMEIRPQPVGQIVRPGSTSMWAQLRFINGYSPIRPSGVAREFQSAIHGEIDFNIAKRLLANETGPDGLLAELGVDGITVATDYGFVPQPMTEWEIVASADEGRVFHRRGLPSARVRSVMSLPSRPNQHFAIAKISGIRDSRNYVAADVDVPAGGDPALITFSRAYFPGYQAKISGRRLKVDSERSLFPVVEVPAGSIGRLTLCYRPAWLVYGGAAAVACGVIWVAGLIGAAWRP